MPKWFAGLVVASVFVSAPALAGWSFHQTVRTSGGREAGATDVGSKVQLEGGDARIEFESAGDNPMFGRGSYLLLRGSAPKGFFLVDATGKTYSKFDSEGLGQAMRPAGGEGESGGMQMTVSDARIEKLLEEPGGELQGVATTHYRYRKSYTMTMAMAQMKMVTAHDIVEDLWLTTAIDLGVGGVGDLMRKTGGSGAMAELAKLSELERQMPAGFALKRVTVDHSKPQGKGMMARMMGGKEETVTSTLEVLDLKQVSIPAATFAIPAGYVERQMMQPGAPAPDLEAED